jgi:hypothetical protein
MAEYTRMFRQITVLPVLVVEGLTFPFIFLTMRFVQVKHVHGTASEYGQLNEFHLNKPHNTTVNYKQNG